MSVEGKIDGLNTAIRLGTAAMKVAADENPNANVLVRALRFSHGATWHVAEPTSIAEFSWTDLRADALEDRTAEIVFAIDTTGSMTPYIDGLTDTCLRFADIIESKRIRARLGLVGFGDLKLGERMTVFPPTEDTQLFKENVRTLPRTGGGDIPESSLDALREALRLESRKDSQKVIVLITDAPPHDPDESGSRWRDILRSLKESNVLLYCIAPRVECWLEMPRATGGEWLPIAGDTNFASILLRLGETVGNEISVRLESGALSGGTDLGSALSLLGQVMRIPPMSDRALPPVLVLISDGCPTDDFKKGLGLLLSEPWGKKAIRIAIGIGKDADLAVLQQFIGNDELRPLKANSPEALINYVRWASTAVLSHASMPATPEKRPTDGRPLPPIHGNERFW